MNVGTSSCTDEPCRACGGTRTEKGDDKTQAGLATSPLGFADDPRCSAFLPYPRLMRRHTRETVAKLRLNARPLCAIQARMLQQ